MMEILSKLYLELSNVVPETCVSSRELKLKQLVNGYGLALMMIREGCADPQKVAGDALAKSLLP